MNLQQLGWTPAHADAFQQYQLAGCRPARIIRQERDAWFAQADGPATLARISGRFRNQAIDARDLPAVGDWVAVRHEDGTTLIEHLLPRKSMFVRQMAGRKTAAQVVASNIDLVFLVSGLDADFNVRRIERYLALAFSSGAVPVVLLNKADVCGNVAERLAAVQLCAPGTAVHTLSALEGDGVDTVRGYLSEGKTGALLGSSGVGKSTLANALLGESRQATRAVRGDDAKGRHTTTHRELFVLPAGGILIDTPGMRELHLTGDADVADTFSEIETIAQNCRFRDCTHADEPGCAVRKALGDGTLDPARLASLNKLQREQEFEAAREDPNLQRARRDRWKQIHKQNRKRMKKSHKWYE